VVSKLSAQTAPSFRRRNSTIRRFAVSTFAWNIQPHNCLLSRIINTEYLILFRAVSAFESCTLLLPTFTGFVSCPHIHFPPMAQQRIVAQDLLIIEASRTHADAQHSIGLLWTSDRPVAETSTRQHTTLTTDRHPCPPETSYS
jgi:hypothetical protein